jgi:5'-3' exonuclease
MIVVDFNQTAISNLMAEIGNRTDIEIQVPLLRHMILNSIRGYKQKFGKEFGEIVIACDNQSYWRRDYFKYYKAGRKKAREASGLDWKLIFEAITMIRNEIEDYFPYKVINVDGAEADDIIAVLAEWSQQNDFVENLFPEPKPFLVLSGDHDFIQLQKYENVKQYSPVQKKYVKPEISPEKYIFEHII